MIKCRKPEYYEPNGGWELENGDAKPVIVILDPNKVFAQLQLRPRFEPNAERLASVMKIPENGFLEMPEVRCVHESLVFRQGRHRTVALAKLGFLVYPVVTVEGHASSLLAKFGASVNAARSHFDWSAIEDYSVVGA